MKVQANNTSLYLMSTPIEATKELLLEYAQAGETVLVINSCIKNVRLPKHKNILTIRSKEAVQRTLSSLLWGGVTQKCIFFLQYGGEIKRLYSIICTCLTGTLPPKIVIASDTRELLHMLTIRNTKTNLGAIKNPTGTFNLTVGRNYITDKIYR